jgi:hypothetical protein
LIYCEALENDFVLLVVVLQHQVNLDVRIARDSVIDEFLSLAALTVPFKIVVSGDVPITNDVTSTDKFIFPEEGIASFNVLPKSILNDLPRISYYQLQPVESALTKLSLLPKWPRNVGLLILIGLVLWGLYWLTASEQVPLVTAPTPITLNTSQVYTKAMAGADAASVLQQFANNMALLYTLPGWRVNRIIVNANQLQAQVSSEIGKPFWLYEWARNNGAQLSPAGNAIQLTFTLNPSRGHVPPLMATAQLANIVMQKISQIAPDAQVAVALTTQQQVLRVAQMTINLSNASPLVFILLARSLENLPILWDQGQFALNQGLVSGSIRLRIIGR